MSVALACSISERDRTRGRLLFCVLVGLAAAHVWLLFSALSWLRLPHVQSNVLNLSAVWGAVIWAAFAAIALAWQAFLGFVEITEAMVGDEFAEVATLFGSRIRTRLPAQIQPRRVRLIGFSEERPVRAGSLMWVGGMPLVVTDNLSNASELLSRLTAKQASPG